MLICQILLTRNKGRKTLSKKLRKSKSQPSNLELIINQSLSLTKKNIVLILIYLKYQRIEQIDANIGFHYDYADDNINRLMNFDRVSFVRFA